jgi:uncharacterized protein
MPSTLAELQQARYVSLATFRRSGVAVATPVWCAFEDGNGYVFSAADAGKVKRLRSNPRARLAVCDVRGRLLGEWHEATAEIVLKPAEIGRALQALRRKYGWQMWLADVGSTLTGRFGRRAYIRVRIVESETSSS